MRNEILPSDESGINVLTMDESVNFNREFERLCAEAEEYDFLKGKSPQVLTDDLEEVE